ncbi:MAG TPA: NAD(P)H-hydrate dehydratase [Dehalococcoidia bacterium]|nr:NAD(P)H-hydrate dehydratase [Dehalococcoidia bacterium]
MKVLTAEQTRQIDKQCADLGLPTEVLMENAGRAVAEEVARILGAVDKQDIIVLIGPGNNGGDGLVAARYLHERGARVSLYLCHRRPPNDSNLMLVRERVITEIDAAQDEDLGRLSEMLSSATAVIDAIFGTGKSRPLTGIFSRVLDKITSYKVDNPKLRLIAVDLPSGLDADTGTVDPYCLYADNTVTLGFLKVGLFNFPGAARVGRVSVVDIGIPEHLATGIETELITEQWARAVLPKRPPDANKGSFGRVLVVAGSINYIGAACLACSGATRVGAGLVTLATARSLLPVLATKLTEVTYLPLPESDNGTIAADAAEIIGAQFERYNVLLLGCGIGQGPPVTELISAIIRNSEGILPSLILDADALNTLTQIPRWWQQLPGDAILTPHPGEMARLTGLSVAEIQSDRVSIARRFAQEWQKTIVLKGAYSVIASLRGEIKVSPVAHPGLASAGTGDVLAGTIAGLVAQGLSLFDAAALGVYLHGRAGEAVGERLGDTGMVASDLLPELPLVIKKIKGRPD